MGKSISIAIDYNSYENRVIEDYLRDNADRIIRSLRCSEGNRIWYQIWITQLDMNCIERYFDGYGEVKRWWLRDLQIWYVFFYEKKGNKTLGVLGKDRTKDLIRSIL